MTLFWQRVAQHEKRTWKKKISWKCFWQPNWCSRVCQKQAWTHKIHEFRDRSLTCFCKCIRTGGLDLLKASMICKIFQSIVKTCSYKWPGSTFNLAVPGDPCQTVDPQNQAIWQSSNEYFQALPSVISIWYWTWSTFEVLCHLFERRIARFCSRDPGSWYDKHRRQAPGKVKALDNLGIQAFGLKTCADALTIPKLIQVTQKSWVYNELPRKWVSCLTIL